MASIDPVEGLRSPLGVAKKITGWYIAVAVLFIVLGLFGIIEPGVAGLGVTLLVGWILVIGAVFHFVAAFKGGGAKQVIFQVVIGIVYAIGGLYFLTHTIMGTATLTLLLAGIILAEGVIEVISYFRMRKEGASGWLLVNGSHHPGAGRVDLVPLAVEHRVGHRNASGRESADHRNHAADVRPGRAKNGGHSSGEVIFAWNGLQKNRA